MFRSRAALAMLAILLTACGQATQSGSAQPSAVQSEPAESRSIVIALQGEPPDLDPQQQEDTAPYIADNIYEALLDADPDTGELVPLLAAELPEQTADDTWVVTLRPDITFTNGEPMNADAVVYSVERLIDPEYSSNLQGQFQQIVAAEAIDELTVELTTDGPDPALPARLAYVLRVIPPEHAESENFAFEPVGTGPYMLDSWERGASITLVPNPDYWGMSGREHPWSSADFRFVPDEQVRVSGLRAGDHQIAIDVPPELIEEVPQAIIREGLEYPYIRLKNYEGPLQELGVRQAMAYAIDIESIAETIYGGYATPARCQPGSPDVFGFNPDLDYYPYDPDQARQLLEDSSYAGEEITYAVPTDLWPKFPEVGEAITSYWEDVGFSVNLVVVPDEVWSDQYFFPGVGEGQPDAVMSSRTMDTQDMSRIYGVVSSEGSSTSYLNDEVTALMNEAMGSTDAAEREAGFQEVVQQVCDDAGILWLLNVNDLYGAVEGISWTPRAQRTSLRLMEISSQ
jgi:peptide/nickel transport system substrate-binding protein